MNALSMLTAKRLKAEVLNLEKCREGYYQVIQDEQDPLLFYFLLKGDSDSVYNKGYYMGKIVLPSNYPTEPGDFYMLTPSGRFTINTKICLTNSAYHKDTWSPTWNISNMVIGMVSVFLSDSTSGISHIKESKQDRKLKAVNSVKFNHLNHPALWLKFNQFVNSDGSVKTDAEVNEFIKNNTKKNKKTKKVKEDVNKEKSTPEPDPDPYQEWKNMISNVNINTHDSNLYNLFTTLKK